MPHEIDLQVACDSGSLPDPQDIERWIAAAIRDEREHAEVSIRIVDRDESQTLNHRYRDKNSATNVLSFPSDLPEELKLPLLGDLAVCAPIVEDEAREQGKTLTAHWAHMMIHGTLHLLGYDHIDDEEATHMEALETQIMLGLDFPAPYEESSSTTPRSFSSP
jgi:probable rRNA maturation factor